MHPIKPANAQLQKVGVNPSPMECCQQNKRTSESVQSLPSIPTKLGMKCAALILNPQGNTSPPFWVHALFNLMAKIPCERVACIASKRVSRGKSIPKQEILGDLIGKICLIQHPEKVSRISCLNRLQRSRSITIMAARMMRPQNPRSIRLILWIKHTH